MYQIIWCYKHENQSVFRLIGDMEAVVAVKKILLGTDVGRVLVQDMDGREIQHPETMLAIQCCCKNHGCR